MKHQLSNEKTAVIYARYSSDNQREESIDAQVRACTEYATKKGYHIVGKYIDKARSGRTDDRDEFQNMIKDSSSGNFHYVMVHKLDRFSRDRYDSIIYKQKLLQNNVQLLSVLEQFDNSPESIMLESVLQGVSSYYVANLSREVMKGMRESAYQATHLGGTPPLGYDVDPVTKKYVINEAEAEIVRLIFHEYTQGNKGYNKILDLLNGLNYKTKRGNQFGKNSLYSILRNEKYTGTFIFNLRKERTLAGVRNPTENQEEDIIRVEDGMPAIISKELFALVQDKLRKNQTLGGSHKMKEHYLLSGLVHCAECGSSMHGNTRYSGRGKSKYSSYRCSNRSQYRGCANKEIRKEYLENYLLDDLYERFFLHLDLQDMAEKLVLHAERNNTVAQNNLQQYAQGLTHVEEKISQVLALLSESGVSIDTVSKQLQELEQQKKTLEDKIRESQSVQRQNEMTQEQMMNLLDRSKDFIKAKNKKETRQFINSYFDAILVGEENITVLFKMVHLDDMGQLVPISATFRREEIYQEHHACVRA